MDLTEFPAFYREPLGVCILAGDIGGVMHTIDAMSPAERAAALVGVQALMIDRWKLVRQRTENGKVSNDAYGPDHANRLFRAVELARYLCTPDHVLADYWMHIGIQDIAAFQQRYQPARSDQPLEKQLRGEQGWDYRHRIHRAVVAGLLPRPETDEYLESLFFGDLRQASNVVLKHVDADPGLAPILLHLFEREGASDTSFAAVEKYCHDPALHWSTAFLTLCERGVYTRAQLLDKTLGALSCDWPQFKSGWFSRFHGSLKPTIEEMDPHAQRYVALCHSRIAPTVSLAVEAVATLYRADVLQFSDLQDALTPVLRSSTKAHVLAALDVLTQAVKSHPTAALSASGLAVHALAHTAADVQKKTLACLKQWGLDADTREAAQAALPLLAAVNQPLLRTLLGAAGEHPVPHKLVPPAEALASLQSTLVTPMSPLDASRAIAPIVSVPELVECIAYVFENQGDIDAWERAAGALVRMAPLPPAAQSAFAALEKRAKRFTWQDKPLAFALAQLMAIALGQPGAPIGLDPSSNGMRTSADFVAWRANSLVSLARQGRALLPLSTPTHRGGFVDPAQLEQRFAAYVQAGALPDPQDHALARMRQPNPNGSAPVPLGLTWSVTTSEGEYAFHSLYIHAEPSAQACDSPPPAAALTAKWLTHERWQSERDAACIRFVASLRPGDLDAFYAEGAHALGNNLDWWEANWQNRAYLDVLLESTAPLSPMGCLLIAVTLAGKEPGQTALAVDALVRCLQLGRVSSKAMAEYLSALWATPLIKGPRIAKSLAAVAAAEVTLHLAVYFMVCAMVVVQSSVARKDSAPLLELMLELQLSHALALPQATRQGLAALRFSGKAKAAVQALLVGGTAH